MKNIMLEIFKMYGKCLDANYMKYIKGNRKLHIFKYKLL